MSQTVHSRVDGKGWGRPLLFRRRKGSSATRTWASNLMAMSPNLRAMAFNLLAMASKHLAMASLAMVSKRPEND